MRVELKSEAFRGKKSKVSKVRREIIHKWLKLKNQFQQTAGCFYWTMYSFKPLILPPILCFLCNLTLPLDSARVDVRIWKQKQFSGGKIHVCFFTIRVCNL